MLSADELELRVQHADDALLQQVIELVKHETQWNWSCMSFELVEGRITAFTAWHRVSQQMVASALLAAPCRDCSSSWVGFVVVASEFRRRGVASCVLSALIENASTRHNVQRIELLASQHGEMVYKTLGFHQVCELSVWLMEYAYSAHHRFSHELGRCDGVLIVARDESLLRQQASELCNSVAGERSAAIQALFRRARCIVWRHANGEIGGASWLRRVENNNVETWWLGPVICERAPLAKRMVRAAVAYAHQHSTATNARVQTLALNCAALFEQMHFRKVRAVPWMRRETRAQSRASASASAARSDAAQYVALFDYHIG
eukprot:TRINITY_DN657_c0_g1_i3.p2 TRINITY_DN657_c0_g1~~TRINITY_DN657_c0_g1_i3.p2  ORF type:complete len:319 (-),score=64.91 TRINITY_DN657_c0_g1_i3:209-1165(-)